MNYETARAYARRVSDGSSRERVVVEVPVRTGTHHTIVLFERDSEGNHSESWRDGFPSRMRDVELEARVGDIVYQRTTSPASGDVLERYGVVRGDHDIDWGVDADWVVDFGPMGDVTRRGLRGPSASRPMKRGRTTAAPGKEVVGGAVPGAGSTAGGGSG